MKRGFKRLLSIMLAAVMVFAMGTTVLAQDVSTTVTVENLSGHTFAAYAIFTGTYDSTNGVLSDVVWGDGINSDTLLSTLAADDTVIETAPSDVKVSDLFSTSSTATQVATVLAQYNQNETLIDIFVKAAYAAKTTTSTTISDATTTMPAGYYLIVDTTTSLANGEAYNNALLQVVGTTVTIEKKTDAPSVEKKVEEKGYMDDTKYPEGYNDVADYSEQDEISYLLIGTVPDMSEFEQAYIYTFTDTLSKGLTLNYDASDPSKGTITVYAVANDTALAAGSGSWDVISSTSGYYTISTSTYSGSDSTFTGGTVLTVSFSNLKTVNAGTSSTVINNTNYKYIVVSYTATLNADAVVGLAGNPNEVYLTYSNNPNATSDSDNTTSNTPKDRVIVFTYELDVTKVDSSTSAALSDAKFVLYRGSGTNTEYVQIDSTTNKVTGWTTDKDQASTLTSGTDGTFKVVGLEDGTYYLEETEAPSGYNKLSGAITLVITATTANGQSWTSGEANEALTALTISVGSKAAVQGSTSTGIVSATVENTKGTVLPGTGGIGTTIFYIVGAILMVGAGVILITRRRMNRG